MARHFSKRRFVHCYKYNFRFYTWEDYYESDTPGMFTLTFTPCGAAVEGTKSNRHCNGIDDHGNPCPYATGRYNSLVPEDRVPK